MFANAQGGGQDLAAPDVCLTPGPPLLPPVPIPYVNIAMGPMAVGAVPNILFGGTPAHNLGTTIPLTNGDNAGSIGGVASGTDMGKASHITGANTMLVGGIPATRMTSITSQNTTNATGARISPSQTKVLILSP